MVPTPPPPPLARRPEPRARGPAASVQFGQYPPARRTLLHLSDTHLLAGNRALGGATTRRRICAAPSRRSRRLGIRPDAHRLHRRSDRSRRARGLPRAARRPSSRSRSVSARRWCGSRAITTSVPRCAATCSACEPTEEPVTGVWDLGGLRLIALDSTVPGWHHGDLDDAQLDVAARRAARPRRRSARSSRCTIRRCRRMCRSSTSSSCATRDASPRRSPAPTCARILAGHLHYSTQRHVRGRARERRRGDLLHDEPRAARRSTVNGMDAGQSFHLVHVYDDTITHAVVPVVEAPTGDFFSAGVGRADVAAHARGAPRGVLAQARLTARADAGTRRRADVPVYTGGIAGARVGSRHPSHRRDDPQGLTPWLWTQ